jgi:hypothetical protein
MLAGSVIIDEIFHAISDVYAKKLHCARVIFHGSMAIIFCWDTITERSAAITGI